MSVSVLSDEMIQYKEAICNMMDCIISGNIENLNKIEVDYYIEMIDENVLENVIEHLRLQLLLQIHEDIKYFSEFKNTYFEHVRNVRDLMIFFSAIEIKYNISVIKIGQNIFKNRFEIKEIQDLFSYQKNLSEDINFFCDFLDYIGCNNVNISETLLKQIAENIHNNICEKNIQNIYNLFSFVKKFNILQEILIFYEKDIMKRFFSRIYDIEFEKKVKRELMNIYKKIKLYIGTEIISNILNSFDRIGGYINDMFFTKYNCKKGDIIIRKNIWETKTIEWEYRKLIVDYPRILIEQPKIPQYDCNEMFVGSSSCGGASGRQIKPLYSQFIIKKNIGGRIIHTNIVQSYIINCLLNSPIVCKNITNLSCIFSDIDSRFFDLQLDFLEKNSFFKKIKNLDDSEKQDFEQELCSNNNEVNLFYLFSKTY